MMGSNARNVIISVLASGRCRYTARVDITGRMIRRVDGLRL